MTHFDVIHFRRYSHQYLYDFILSASCSRHIDRTKEKEKIEKKESK